MVHYDGVEKVASSRVDLTCASGIASGISVDENHQSERSDFDGMTSGYSFLPLEDDLYGGTGDRRPR